MRHVVTLALLALAAAAPTLAVGAAPATTQVFLQRTGDGRLLLTDKRAPGATVERSWQFEREDPAAASRRAREVSMEAQAVSERVQRELEQRRRADLEEQRLLALLDRDRQRAGSDRDMLEAGGVVLYPVQRFRSQRLGLRFDDHVGRGRGGLFNPPPRLHPPKDSPPHRHR